MRAEYLARSYCPQPAFVAHCLDRSKRETWCRSLRQPACRTALLKKLFIISRTLGSLLNPSRAGLGESSSRDRASARLASSSVRYQGMMFESKTRRNFAFYLTFHVTRYAFPLIITPFLAHYLMKDGFGQYAVINSCVWSTVIFMDFGFYIYGINRIAYADTVEEISREASAIVSAKIALLPVCVVAYTVLIIVSGMFAKNPTPSMLGR